jgi:tRNA dimethylallyltransferase
VSPADGVDHFLGQQMSEMDHGGGPGFQPGRTGQRPMPPIIALVGPTGAGKTELGVALAQQFNAEIINADSRQVYRRLDVGSAKPTPEQRAAVAHHIVDVVEPDEPFSCARFRQLALDAIDDIRRRGKRVLVVGGTGLYIKALLHGLFEGPSRDIVLRAALLREEGQAAGTLYRQLQAVDPAAAARLHPHDRIRVIRALEVYHLTGRPISDWQAEHGFGNGTLDACVLGLSLSRAELYARINARCQAMVDAGLIDEVRRLYADGFAPDLPALRSPGYREIGAHVRGLCDLPTAIARMAQATRRLAKRQVTWFRADPEIVWCTPDLAVLQQRTSDVW